MSIYSKLSPYATTTFTGSYLGIINFRDIPSEIDDVVFDVTSQYEFRPDLLSYDLYGTSDLWWVFAVRNKNVIKDSIYDLFAGQRIYLPKLTTLQLVLGF